MSTFVLVHGICHGAWCWDRTRAALETHGHHVVAPDLTLTSLRDDAAIVSRALDQLDEPAVLVGHSSGGLVISRAAAGRDDVRHLVYPAGVMMGSADNFFAATGDFPVTPLGRRMSITNGIITIDPDVAVACLYNECAPADAVAAAGRLRPAALACLTEPAGAEPWRGTPSTYICCEHDRAIHPQMQQAMSQHAARTITLNADHSPFMSRPRKFLEIMIGPAVAGT